MTEVKIYHSTDIPDEKIEFAVIVSRYKDNWVFCRHKNRSTWEIPGGHRESGESIEMTAHRELYEETGSKEHTITQVAIYSVEKFGSISYGMLFYAEVRCLDMIPKDSEIAEIKFFNILPNELTYPDIQPHLYNEVQGWLNLQSSSDELWDILDDDRKYTGLLHRRGDYLRAGEYHLVVHVWLENSNGEYLLTKRSPNKGFPNMWETTGGSAIAGDDSLTAALREVKEETGLSLNPNAGKCIYSYKGDNYFTDVWKFKQDFELNNVVLQDGETCDKIYASIKKIKEIHNMGLLYPYSYLSKLFFE